MARSHGPLIPEDDTQSFYRDGSRAGQKDQEMYAAPGEGEARSFDGRFLDLDSEEQSPFLRGQKRVPVRRGPLPKKTATRLGIALAVLGVLFVLGLAATALYRYAVSSSRFRVQSSDAIEIAGTKYVTRAQVLQVMGSDIGRNVFFIPLDERRRQIENIPWVESATVMRLLPDRLKIEIRQRTPVAFARVDDRIELIDATGVIMEAPADGTFSFPVIAGNTDSDPLSTRAARMKTYLRLVRELDSTGANYSRELDEVDLADPEDTKVTVVDPNGALLIHLGSENYLERFRIYKSHVQEWRQQFQKLQSIDLRYDRQVIVNPEASVPAAPVVKPAPRAMAQPAAAGKRKQKH